MPERSRSATSFPRRRRGRSLVSEHDLGPADRTPWGTHGRGSPSRSVRLTPLGWAYVSPEVRARIRARLGEVAP